MGLRGPKPKLPPIAKAPERPAPPRDFGDDEREAWESLCDDLAEAKTLRPVDRKLIELYARNHAMLARVEAQLAGEELTMENDQSRTFVNPLANLWLKLTAKERQYLLDCGLAPTGRKVTPGDEENPILGLVAGEAI